MLIIKRESIDKISYLTHLESQLAICRNRIHDANPFDFSHQTSRIAASLLDTSL